MSPRIPVELAYAKEQRAEAWRKYDEAVDRNADPDGFKISFTKES